MASVADDLTAGVVALLGTLSLTGATIRDRKISATMEGETSPVISVWIRDDWDYLETSDDDYGRAGMYELVIAIGRKSPLTVTDKATDRTWRQAIRRRLTQWPGLTGVPAVDFIDSKPTPQFDAGMLDSGWNWVVLAFDVKTREARVA